MSTYNGEKYLEEQLDSIIKQKDVKVDILVRDDGSTDSTHKILNDWQAKGKLKWYTGENLKPARSFLKLLQDAEESEYYAFSDQDDYWISDKLSTSLKMLSQYKNVPAMYFSQTQLADKHLKQLDSVIINPYLTFGEALVSQFVGGCTMVMNKKLRDIVVRYRPDYLTMHDVWIYNVALGIGAKVIFDPVPHMLYRQHGNNVVGQGFGHVKKWERRFSRLCKSPHDRYLIAKEIQNGFIDFMPDDKKSILKKFILGKDHLYKRLKLCFDKDFKCFNKKTYRYFQLSVLFNLY